MPLPIYTAFAIEAPAILGGSTQPTIMSVKDGLGKIIGAFVVKVFKWGNIEQYQPTNKEVYCNVLASSFDLETPFGALIHVEQYLIDELKSNPKYVNFDLRPGYYFGSKYLPNASLFQANSDDKLLDDSSLENIFAFDVLIRNMDRRVNKPNMLILKDSPVLIDHDIALQIEKSFEEYVELGLWNVLKTEWRKHLLLDR